MPDRGWPPVTGRGRPPIGQVVEVRLDGAILQALDFYTDKWGFKSRAAAIRSLLEDKLNIIDCEYCGRGVGHGEFCERIDP